MESDIPCVLIDIPIESRTVGYVTTDNVLGAKKAVRHLIELGHKRIAMINGYEYAFVSEQRLKGFKEALLEAGLPVREYWIANGAFREEIAEQEALRLLQHYPEITAFFCASDLMALGVIKAVKRLGKRVPDDVAVIGYDDIILASYSSPSLSTIAQDKFAMGYEAAKLLIAMLEGKADSHIKILQTELKARESTVKGIK